jgi:hypothetical protein
MGAVKPCERFGEQAHGEFDFARHLLEAVVTVSGQYDALISIDGREAWSFFDLWDSKSRPPTLSSGFTRPVRTR